MMQAVVHLGVDVFSRNRRGRVFGELTVRAGEVEFPAPGWTDFVVVVLTDWCEALSRVLAGETGPIGVRFMDGPYVVEFGPLDNDLIHLVFVEDRLKRTVSYETDADSAVLLRSLLASVDRALKECRDRGWCSGDEDRLAAARTLVGEHFQMH
jgi:hypothetical protein